MSYRNFFCVLFSAAGLATSAQAQVVNGDFETGDFTGWTQFGDTTFDGVDGLYAHGGVMSAYFGSADPTGSGVTQIITAPAGSSITVHFWLMTDFGDIPNSYSATLDGQLLSSGTDYTDTNWVEYTATIVTTTANPELKFTFFNELDYYQLDDVTVEISTGPAPCYANCDGSTSAPLLTANDFQCFLNKYAANDTYANCDGSTAVPTLTANDFQCFLNKYAAGCS